MPVHVSAQDAHRDQGVVRCFRCPKERRGTDPGWYFIDLSDRGGFGDWYRVFVCPKDYQQFAEAEQARWTALGEEPADATVTGPMPDHVPQELIALLSLRGLAGWALLVRDVAEGRVRRVHLRRLPADPEIRHALVTYLQSAGAEITLGLGLRTWLHHQPGGNRGTTPSGLGSPPAGGV